MRKEDELIRKAKAGEEDSLEQLLRRYEARVFTFLLKMIGNRQGAEDATQEALIAAVRGLPGYREQGKFKSWMFRIAHREGLRVLKKTRRSKEEPSVEIEQLLDPSSGPQASALAQEQRRQLAKAVAQLSEVEREVVHLRIYEELSFKDIAEIMGSSLNTALGRMHAATRKLKSAIESQESADE